MRRGYIGGLLVSVSGLLLVERHTGMRRGSRRRGVGPRD